MIAFGLCLWVCGWLRAVPVYSKSPPILHCTRRGCRVGAAREARKVSRIIQGSYNRDSLRDAHLRTAEIMRKAAHRSDTIHKGLSRVRARINIESSRQLSSRILRKGLGDLVKKRVVRAQSPSISHWLDCRGGVVMSVVYYFVGIQQLQAFHSYILRTQ